MNIQSALRPGGGLAAMAFLLLFASSGFAQPDPAQPAASALAVEAPELSFWNQEFVREDTYARILSLPLQQNKQMGQFRGLCLKRQADGMDLTDANAKMDEAFKRFNDAQQAAYDQLFRDLTGIAGPMLLYEPPECTEDEFVYVAIGASMALGAGADPPSKGFVYLIGDRLRERFPNVRVRNLAVGGKTTQHAREEQLPAALTLHPDLITYTAGLNDLQYGVPVETARENTEFILKTLREQTHAKIVMTRMSVAEKLPALSVDVPKLQARRPNLSHERVEAFSQAYTELAEKYGATLVDVGSVIKSDMTESEIDGLFSFDGVHPNNQGHEKVAELFWAGIAAALDLK